MVSKKEIQIAKEVSLASLVIDSGAQYRRGTDHIKISCPFHGPERTPSCAVYDDHYYCYGCSASGDIIDFVMHVEEVPFDKAVELILKALNE